MTNTFDNLPIGTRVKIVSKWVDFYPFWEEVGTVCENKHGYLGVIVRFDEPRQFKDWWDEDVYIQEVFNFNPEDLEIIR